MLIIVSFIVTSGFLGLGKVTLRRREMKTGLAAHCLCLFCPCEVCWFHHRIGCESSHRRPHRRDICLPVSSSTSIEAILSGRHWCVWFLFLVSFWLDKESLWFISFWLRSIERLVLACLCTTRPHFFHLPSLTACLLRIPCIQYFFIQSLIQNP